MDDVPFNKLMMECNNCHLQFRVGNLKVDTQQDFLVCNNCLVFPGSKINIIRDPSANKTEKKRVSNRPTLSKPTMSKPVVITKPVAAKPAPAPIARTVAVPKMRLKTTKLEGEFENFRCVKCRYIFSRKSGWNDICPYCADSRVQKL